MGESKKEKDNLEEREARGKILNKIALIIVIVLLCAACFGIGFAVNFKIVNNTSNATSNQKNSKTNAVSNEKTLTDPTGTTECNYDGNNVDFLDVTDPLVQETSSKVENALSRYCGVWDEYTDGIFSANDFDKTLVFEMGMREAYKSANKQFKEGIEISKNDFYSALRRLFGKDFADKFDGYKDYNGCPSFKYDATKEVFTQQPSACGGTCGPHNVKKIVKAIKSDNSLIIYQRVVFLGENFKYFKDSKLTNEINSQLSLDNDGFIINTDSNYNKGSLYKLTFNYEDGNYVFATSEYLG